MASWIVRIAAFILEMVLAITVFQLGLRVGSGFVPFLVGFLGLVVLAGIWGVFLSPKSPKRLPALGRAILALVVMGGVASLVAMSGAPGLATWLMVGAPILALCEYSLEVGGDGTPMARPYY